MKKLLTYIIFLVASAGLTLGAQPQDILSEFIEKNPNAIDYDIIYEGSKLNLSADDDFLLVNLSISHPALQMRFMMQRVNLYVDPTGKKKKKYEVIFPSALDVREYLDETEDPAGVIPVSPTAEERPDIRPLIGALNKRGASYRHNGVETHLDNKFFYVEHDRYNEVLNYYVMIPKDELMLDKNLKEKWTIGIISDNDAAMMHPSGQNVQGDPGGMMPPPPDGDDNGLRELMQSNIREWVKFPIDEVNNVNIK